MRSKTFQGPFTPGEWTHIPSDDHAAQLVNDEHVQLWWRLTELLLQDLQDVLHDFGSVSQSYSDVAQRSNRVIWNQVGIPREEKKYLSREPSVPLLRTTKRRWNGFANFSFSCEIYSRLDRLAKKASTITWSMVRPALRHLQQKNDMDNQQSKCPDRIFLF